MIRILCWDGVLDRRILGVRRNDTPRSLTILLNGDRFIEVVADEEPYGLDFYPVEEAPNFNRPIDLSTIIGRKVEKILVPYLAPAVSDEGWITFGFTDYENVILAAEHPYRGISIIK